MKEFFIRRFRSDRGQPDGRRTLLRVDDSGVITYADNHAEAVLGFDANDLEGCPVTRIVAARQDDPFAPNHRHRFENGEAVLLTLRHRDGFYFTAQVALRMDMRDSDQAASACISLRDHTPPDPRLLQLAETSAGLGIWELDIETNQLVWTEGLYRLLDLRPGTEITPEQALFYSQGHQARIRTMFRRCIRTGQPFTTTFDLFTARQQRRRVTLTGRALKSGQRIQRLGGTLVDHTREMQQDDAREQAHRLLGTIIGATSDLVAAVDNKLNLLCFNQAFAHQFFRTFERAPQEGDNLVRLLQDYPNERRLIERLWHRAFERDSFVVEMPLAQQNRQLPVYEIHYQRLVDSQGEVLGAIHVARDITERVRAATNSNYLNQHDPITGLLNRREFIHRLERLMAQSRMRGSTDSLLFLDLDRFAHFNDTTGSGACDRYLRELAGALGAKVRQRDALARLAGDTFALLVENCPEAEARKVADNVLELVREFVFEWQGKQLQTTASAGLLILDERAPTEPEQLLSQAADLCHTAKIAGRNRIHAAHADARAPREQEARKLLEHIEYALENDGLILEYQALRPVTSVTWGDHIEILARVAAADPDQSPLPPGDFLPVAERFDLAKHVDRQVIRKTLAWLGQHKLLEPRLKYCGFNLSMASVLDDGFADFLEALLADSPFPPECFCMEIRESDATQYPDEVAVLCDALHRIGCRVALDGAGASVESYSLAARLPVDIIKLDQKMMQHLHDDPVQQVMVEALHKIAEAAGKTTVATFIENDDTLRKVRALGIHYGQGYRLCKPQPLEALAPAAVQLDTGRIGG